MQGALDVREGGGGAGAQGTLDELVRVVDRHRHGVRPAQLVELLDPEPALLVERGAQSGEVGGQVDAPVGRVGSR